MKPAAIRNGSRAPHCPAPDFVAPRRPPAVAWLICVAGVLMFVAVAWQGLALRQALLAEHAALARWSAPARPVARAGPVRNAALSAASASSAWRSVDALRYPWPRLLAVVDEASLPGVQWLGLEHQVGQPELRLEGWVPDADVATALVAALSAQPGWATAMLTRLGRPEGPRAGSGLRFEILIRIDRSSIDGGAAQR